MSKTKQTKVRQYKEHPKHQAKKQLNAAKYNEKIKKNSNVVIQEPQINDTQTNHINPLFRLLVAVAAIQALTNLFPQVKGRPISSNKNHKSSNKASEQQLKNNTFSYASSTPFHTTNNNTQPIFPIHNEPQSNCHVARLGFDIGSSGTKVKGAIINVCKGTQKEIYSKNYPIKYRADLDKNPNNEFSKEIQDAGLTVISQAKQEFQEKITMEYPDASFESCGVATAAFRKAANGKAVAQSFSATLDNMPIDILTQEEEGKIAYQAALGKAREDNLALKNPITWDIGGGSMQFSNLDPTTGSFAMCGSKVASQTVFKLISDNIPSNSAVFGADFSKEQLEQGIILILKEFPKNDPTCNKIMHDIKAGSDVLAVGSFHNLGIKPLVNGVLDKNSNSYTQTDIVNTLGKLIAQGATPEVILQHNAKLLKEFIPNQLLDLLLTTTTMEKMDIDQVKTLEINNADGLMLSGCPWRSTSNGPKELNLEATSNRAQLR